jgi:predicted  nucleic acid-binding Zn-ribbon protein
VSEELKAAVREIEAAQRAVADLENQHKALSRRLADARTRLQIAGRTAQAIQDAVAAQPPE